MHVAPSVVPQAEKAIHEACKDGGAGTVSREQCVELQDILPELKNKNLPYLKREVQKLLHGTSWQQHCNMARAIAAEFQTPGPASIALKGLFGSETFIKLASQLILI